MLDPGLNACEAVVVWRLVSTACCCMLLAYAGRNYHELSSATGQVPSKHLALPARCPSPSPPSHMQAVVCTTGDLMPSLCADIEPDLKVRAAMNEINAAQRLRRAGRHALFAPFSKAKAWPCLLSHALG